MICSNNKITLFIFTVLLFGTQSICASDYQINRSTQTNNILASEPFLHFAGAPTADVLRKKENNFHVWGWGAYGITNNLTFIYDWLVVLAGIPAGFIRYQLPSSIDKFTYSLEFYGVSLERFDEPVRTVGNEEFDIKQKGWQAYAHLNTTYRINKKLRMHVSAGSTYDTYQQYAPKEKAKFSEVKIYEDYYTFDLATGFDYLLKKNMRFSVNYIKGNQLFVYDQNPQKYAIQMSIQFVPFPNWKHGFFKNMRIELWGYYVNFPELKYKEFLPPIWPLISWQW